MQTFKADTCHVVSNCVLLLVLYPDTGCQRVIDIRLKKGMGIAEASHGSKNTTGAVLNCYYK